MSIDKIRHSISMERMQNGTDVESADCMTDRLQDLRVIITRTIYDECSKKRYGIWTRINGIIV